MSERSEGGSGATPRRRGRPGYDLAGLLDVVVEVFNERGFDGTRMRDLSQRPYRFRI